MKQHPSIKDYKPAEPIPEGYKLEKLISSNGIQGLTIELLLPIKKENKKAA